MNYDESMQYKYDIGITGTLYTYYQHTNSFIHSMILYNTIWSVGKFGLLLFNKIQSNNNNYYYVHKNTKPDSGCLAYPKKKKKL